MKHLRCCLLKDENKDILISLLNSLLDFKGEKEIVDVEINPTELEVMRVSEKKGKFKYRCCC